MNLVDLLDENGLQQDEWSLTKPVFGKEGQLQVVGWSGKSNGGHKHYIVKCSKCQSDPELFGEGYFSHYKGDLKRGYLSCGCMKSPRWSLSQYKILCNRYAHRIGYTFLGFVGEWKGACTRVRMFCEKHGEWSSGIITTLINGGKSGCPMCRIDLITKPDEVMIASFHKSKAFHPDTKFWRSERSDRQGRRRYWHVYCPECGESGEGYSGDLQKGSRPCACNRQRQKEAYIHWIVDDYDNTVAIKFGISRDSKKRRRQQGYKTTYEVRQYVVYTFQDVASCKKAERECLQQLECGVILKRDLPDGYTETTWTYNLEKIIEIYKQNGGTLNERE